MDLNATSAQGISVIIPVYNEALIINDTVRHVRDSAGDNPVEIVVVDGGPGHATLAVVEDAAVVQVTSPAGRGTQMNAGAAVASHSVLLFLHADTRLPHGWPSAVLSALIGSVRAGAFSLSIDSPCFSLALISFFANLRTSLERVPYGDQAPFFDVGFFRDQGGFADIPIMEDVELFRRIRLMGERIVILKERVLTSARRWEQDGVLRRTLSNWRLRILYRAGATPQMLARSYPPNDEEP